MAKEIERKFLVKDESFKSLATEKHEICQAYLSTRPEATVRVRVLDSEAYITVKGRNSGAVRREWEYAIPVDDALEMLGQCVEQGTVAIEKTRYIVPAGDSGLRWEVDEFRGAHAGLVVAEIELPDEGYALGTLPGFIGREVTGDARYYNSALASSADTPLSAAD